MKIGVNIMIAFLLTFFLLSCVEKRPTPPTTPKPNSGMAKQASSPANAKQAGASVKAKKSKYVLTGNKLNDLVRNVGLTKEQANGLFKIQADYKTEMANHKNEDGTYANNKIRSLAKEQQEAIESYLGEAKFKDYQLFKHWSLKQARARRK